jgi:RLL motif-containing protein 1
VSKRHGEANAPVPMPPLARKLRALAYPGWATVNVDELQQFHALVVWLEDKKIRSLPKEEREPLRTLGDPWAATLREYLEEVGCPHPLEDLSDLTQRRVVADWLLGEAVGLEYLDNSARHNSRADAAAALPPALRAIDYADAEVQRLVASLAQMLRIPAAETTADTMALVERAVREKLSPAALAGFEASGGASRDEGLDKFPQDFSTGDAAVDAGSKVLRLLYIDDLRRLQTAVNNVIVRAQEFTANPKTDAKLGKVGY